MIAVRFVRKVASAASRAGISFPASACRSLPPILRSTTACRPGGNRPSSSSAWTICGLMGVGVGAPAAGAGGGDGVSSVPLVSPGMATLTERRFGPYRPRISSAVSPNSPRSSGRLAPIPAINESPTPRRRAGASDAESTEY